MIVQKNFLSKLRDFGLNTYESKLWTALLSRGLSTAGELSDIANVPRSRTYDVLESLEKKGFIIRKIGKPIKYIAVPPEEVVERIKSQVEAEAKTQVESIEELKTSDILNELNLLHKQGVEMVDSSEMTASINGRDNLTHHVESRIGKAKSTLYMMVTESGLIRKAKFLLPSLMKMKDVDVKIATQITDKNKDIVKQLSKYAEVRHSPKKGRFIIVDGNEVTFMLLDDAIVHPSYDLGVWINSEFFSNNFHEMFKSKWKDMKKFE